MRRFTLTMAVVLLAVAGYSQQPSATGKYLSEVQKAQYVKQLGLKPTSLTLPKQAATNRLASQLRKAAQGTPITEQPEGTLYKNLYTYAKGFTSMWGMIYEDQVDGATKDLVVAADGTCYIKNPISFMATDSWIKGKKTVGDTIAVELPQAIYVMDNGDGNTVNYFAYKMKYEQIDGENQYVVDDASQTVKFVWRNDSLVKADNTSLIGMGNPNGVWNGLGDLEMSATVCPFTNEAPSANATVNKYVVSYHPSSSSTHQRIMSAAFDGDNVFIKGLDTSLPDAWIKGKRDGNQIVFPGAQFLGLDTVRSNYKFCIPGVERWNDEEYYSELVSLPNATFTYDEATQSFTTKDGFVTNYGYRAFQESFSVIGQPAFNLWNEIVAAPQNPRIIQYSPATTSTGYLIFAADNYNVEGAFMDPDKTFYNIYFDDELVTFAPDQYVGLTEEMTDVPINFDETTHYDIQTYGNQHRLNIYDIGFERIGVQVIYKDGDKRLTSDIVYYPESTGIDNGITSNNAAKHVYYVDLSGRKVAQPAHGMYIKTMKMDDGSVKSVKVIVK